MKVSILDKLPAVDGWVFLPLKKVLKGVSGVAPQPFPGLPIDIHDWEASSESAWQTGGKAFFKASPINSEGKSILPFQDALGKGLKFLSARKAKKVAVVLPRLSEVSPEVIDAVFEVPDLLTYDTAPYKSRPDAKKPFSVQEIFFVCREKEALPGLVKRLSRMRIIADAINFARKAADEPSNLMTPSQLARHASLLKKDGVRVSVLPDSIVRKMGGVQAVSAGSAQPPKFIVMELNPGKGRPVMLIGKGVTFDSGGISIKPADLMWEMKHDMAGGAAVIGAMKALAGLGCRRRVIGLVPAVENMPDGRATRPGDVIECSMVRPLKF